MEQLNSLDASSLQKYLHGVVDGYIGRSTSHISNDDTLKQLPNPSKSRLSIEIIDIFQQSVQKNDIKYLQTQFNKVPKKIIESIINVTTVRIEDIFKESKKRSILAGLPDSLQDFDWSLRVCFFILSLHNQHPTHIYTIYIAHHVIITNTICQNSSCFININIKNRR